MGTRPSLSAPATAAVVAMLLATACGGGNNTAGHSSSARKATAAPSPTSTSTSLPMSAPLGVLVGSQAAASYTVSLVGIDGKVVASAEASSPPVTSCGRIGAAPYPLPVSESNSRVYFMDAQGGVHYLGPDGSTGQATSVPAPSASQRSTFAVSPDDSRIAVTVATYTATQASTRLYVEDLNGAGNHINLFNETGSRSLWAVGWHGTNNLVVAVVPSCTQGGGQFCCGMQELHVIDPATATRRFTIGTWSSCPIVGPPSPAGAVCESSAFTSAQEINWTAGVFNTFAISGPSVAFIAPGGSQVAVVDIANNVTHIRVDGQMDMVACEWIDDSHLLSGGDPQHQPRVGDTTTNTVVPVAAAGDCGGRLPGGL